MRKSIAGIALACGLAWALPSQAATITADKNMDCTPRKGVTDPCWMVSVTGDIVKGDYDRFKKVIEKNQIKVAAVKLSSDGGVLFEGLLIGGTIHELGFSTYVPEDTYCISVCAAMWVSGVDRFATSESRIGFHQAFTKDRRGNLHTDQRINQLVKDYYVKIIGLPKPAADFFVSADPRDVNWLNMDLLNGFKIDVIILPTKAEAAKAGGNQPGTSAPALPPDRVWPSNGKPRQPEASAPVEQKKASMPKSLIDELSGGSL